ncbi:hypothetical protein ACFU99_03610 [Streptomyces sp. NPDC057654]|uniref:hypothetical protein n=1 Tax=Streptomyces sp. NPDC057654 TaxID=3346196 RepID=UPI0036BDBDCB
MASFEAEWAQLKEETSAGSGMRLASAGGGSAGGSGGVKSKKDVWDAAASDVEKLAGNAKKALTSLEKGQKGMGKGGGAGGVASLAAQHELYGSWKHYLDEVRGRCEGLKGPLEKAGRTQHGNDKETKSLFDKLGDQYKDTPAVGGQSRGR